MRTESNLNTTCVGLSDECKECTMGKAIKTVACIVMEQVGDSLETEYSSETKRFFYDLVEMTYGNKDKQLAADLLKVLSF